MGELTRRDLLKASLAMAIAPSAVRAGQPTRFGPGRHAGRGASDPYGDAVLVDGEVPQPRPGSFTIAVLPDTQYYSEKYPETFRAQTNWLVENKDRRNIAFVLHLGDITEHNTPAEWENAVAALSVLDGELPLVLVAGNHDLGGGQCHDRTTRLNDHFPVAKFKDLTTFGGVYDKEPERINNSYHRFTAGGRKFLVLGLEFGPRRDVVRWAKEVVEDHRDHEAILTTHAYLYSDNTRYDWKKKGPRQLWNPHSYRMAHASKQDVMDGEELWKELVSPAPNFVLTLNGHVLNDGLARLATTAKGGRRVQQMLVNFQMRPEGGDGWLRLLEFQPDGETVVVDDYSPTRNQRNKSPKNHFLMTLSKIA